MARLKPAADGVWVATSHVYLTTSTVVRGQDGRALLVDPGVTFNEMAELAADLKAIDLAPSIGFSTHPHWDHLLWSHALGDAPRLASPEAVATTAREHTDLANQAREADPAFDLSVFGQVTSLPEGQATLTWPGPSAQVIIHGAHAPGHAALYFPDGGILVAGDMLSDVEIPLLDLDQADPVADYRHALDRFSTLAVNLLIPGHGHVGGPREFEERLVADRRYLDDLTASRTPSDVRLRSEWLRQEHARQAASIRTRS